MAQYCEICGEELDSEEKDYGICEKCRSIEGSEEQYQVDKEYIDPGIT